VDAITQKTIFTDTMRGQIFNGVEIKVCVGSYRDYGINIYSHALDRGVIRGVNGYSSDENEGFR